MKSSDITLAILIIVIFLALYFYNIMSVGFKNVQNNWPKYRCNPVVMPFAGSFGYDVTSNFTYCIQSVQSNYMEHLLQPMHWNLSTISSIGSELSDGINSIRGFFNYLRNCITDIIRSVFGTFLNLLIEFQRLTIHIKDIFGKLMGIITVLMYTLSGSIMTMNSAWEGPPGQLTRAICFHPDTKIKMKDNTIICMKDAPLNGTMKNNTRIYSVMKISNVDTSGNQIERLYKIKNGENNNDIIVTGSHLIYDKLLKGFVKVEDLQRYKELMPVDYKCEELSCLITDNHTIPIGDWIFHDWEDNNGSPSKDIFM